MIRKTSRFHRSIWLLVASLALLLTGCAQPTPSVDSGEPFGPLAPPSTSTPVVVGNPSPPSEPAPRPPSGEPPATTLALLYTNDARGYLDPCG